MKMLTFQKHAKRKCSPTKRDICNVILASMLCLYSALNSSTKVGSNMYHVEITFNVLLQNSNFWSPWWGRSLSLYYSMKELQKGLP